jgi:HlyD family secretion protein
MRARAAVGSPSARAHSATPVRSPAAGRVLRVLQESETIAPAGSPLLEIGDPGQIEIVAEFLSQDAVLIRAGARALIENWGADTPIAARVFRVEPFARTKISALGVEEQRVNVILQLAQPETAPPLGHGFRVDVRVVLSEEPNALRVPTDALVRDGRGWAVFVIERGRARLAPVGIGEGGEDYRRIETGLWEGQRVVLFPGDDLENGARVRSPG